MGHIVLPNVPSFCPSVNPSLFTFWSLSQQLLHTFNSLMICGCACIYLMNIQAEFEFGSGPMVFDRVNMPLELWKKKWEIHFPTIIIILTTGAHIQFKFDILMYYMNIQVEFGSGMIFERAQCLLNLENSEKFSVFAL